MKNNNRKGGDYTMKLYEGTVSFTGKKHCRVRAETEKEAMKKVQKLLDSTDYLEIYPDEMDVVETSVQELEEDDLELTYLEECEHCISAAIDCLEYLLNKYEKNR